MLKLIPMNKKVVLSSFCAGLLFFASGLNASSYDCSGKTFNIKVKEDTTKLEILNQLSDICNFTVISKDGLSKEKLNEKQQAINIKNLSLDDIFNVLLSEDGLDYVYDNGILKVQGYVVQTFKLDYINSIREANALLQASVESGNSDSSEGSSGGSGETNSIKSQEKFDFWKDIGLEIKNILASTNREMAIVEPVINSNTGMVTVTGTKEQIDRVSEYIETMQQRLKKQVIIDVSIIEVIYEKKKNRGIDWSKFDLSFSTKLDAGNDNAANANNNAGGNATVTAKSEFSNVFIAKESVSSDGFHKNLQANMGINLEGVLNFLDQHGKTRIVSNPKIIAMNNQPAIISVGKTVNYLLKSTNNNDGGGSSEGTENKSIFIGILLNILPEISDDDKVMLRINPALSDFLYTEDDAKQQTARSVAPDTQQKKLSTVVRVNDGQTIVLGGLIDNKVMKNKTEVPLLSKIPLLGYLFKYEGTSDINREIVFIITPRVVELGDYEHKQSLHELGYGNEILGLEEEGQSKSLNFVTIKKLQDLKSKENSLDNMGYEKSNE